MHVAHSRDPGFRALVELLRGADVRFTNLEVTLHEFRGSPQAASGGSYVAASPSLIDDLKTMSFNLYAAANNHTMDWGEGGLLATMETLDRAGAVYAGIGRHLQDARAPRFLETDAGRVALIAATSTFPSHAMAGDQRPDCQGRPGVNPLRFQETITVDPATLSHLREIHDRLHLGAVRDLSVRLGFEKPDPPGIATLFSRRFREGTPEGLGSEPHAGDLAGNLAWIRDARRQADWVVVSLHAHEMLRGDREQPAEFIPAFCRQAVEAGADIVLGHGPHLLRGIEVYRGKPIFYSLGNFIFQLDLLEPVATQPVEVEVEERVGRVGACHGFERLIPRVAQRCVHRAPHHVADAPELQHRPDLADVHVRAAGSRWAALYMQAERPGSAVVPRDADVICSAGRRHERER